MSLPATYERDHTPKLTPAVQVLIAVTLAAAYLQWTLLHGLSGFLAFDFNALPGRWWTAATYAFGHISGWHLAANMYGLYLFGPRLEQEWGAKKFARFYAVCALGGVVAEMLFIRAGSVVGPSAAVFGVMTAYVMQWPDEDVFLFFVIPLSARTAAVGLFVFNVVMGVTGISGAANLAYLAHIGGVLAAWVYVRMAASTAGVEHIRQRVADIPDADEPPRAIPRNLPRRERGDEVDDVVAKSKAIASKRVTTLTPSTRRREGKADELDRVLDKISEQGIDSLTTDERKVLEEMSKRLRNS